MSNNFPRKPVRFIEENQELLKNLNYSEAMDATDYSLEADTTVGTQQMQATYRTPAGRVSGNRLFRRYLNGSLDVDNACSIIMDAIHKFKRQDPMNSLEDVALQALFPDSFPGIDPSMASQVASVQLDLLPQERELIRLKVSAQLAEEMNYNAGMGGGSVPGRHQTIV